MKDGQAESEFRFFRHAAVQEVKLSKRPWFPVVFLCPQDKFKCPQGVLSPQYHDHPASAPKTRRQAHRQTDKCVG